MLSLDLLDPFDESPQESRLRLRLSTGGIVGFHANLAIATTSGRHYRGDPGVPLPRASSSSIRATIIEIQNSFAGSVPAA